jgi:hypothetical protein
MPTDAAMEAVNNLRQGSLFQWYVIPLLALVTYVYAVEVEKRNWSAVFAGLAFWGMDWFNEIWNALVFHFSGFAPVWGAPAKTAYLILVGLNIEICFMFAIAGIVFTKQLPRDPAARILGLPNRLFVAICGSIFCVLIECWLNAVGALTWEYAWWNLRVPWLIFLVGYLPFFLVAFWVYDMKSVRKQITTLGVLYAVIIASLVLFGGILGWI